MPDMSALLNNPAMMNMARQLMSDPNIQNMMSQMMTGILGGGGANAGVSNLIEAGQQVCLLFGGKRTFEIQKAQHCSICSLDLIRQSLVSSLFRRGYCCSFSFLNFLC